MYVIFLAAGVFCATLLCSSLFLRFYSARVSGTCCASTGHLLVAAVSLSVSLVGLLVVPLDIYAVSSELTATGAQRNTSSNHGQRMRLVYDVLWSTSAFLTFFALPFAYFFFEKKQMTEQERARAGLPARPLQEHQDRKNQCCRGLQYAAGFILLFALLIAGGILLNHYESKPAADSDWKHVVDSEFGNATAVLTFTMAACQLFGILSFLLYVPYGLAKLPVALLSERRSKPRSEDRRRLLDPPPPTRSTRPPMTMYEVRTQKKRIEELMQYIDSKYSGSNKDAWSKEDRVEYIKLRASKRRMEKVLHGEAPLESATLGGSSEDKPVSRPAPRKGKKDKRSFGAKYCSAVWMVLAPLRWILGFPLLLLGWFLIIGISISSLDQLLHSTCGASCGFALSRPPTWTNPVDFSLQKLSPYFPLDLFLFGGLIVYMFMCAIHGMASIGIRLLCVCRMNAFRPRRTKPHGILLAVWLLVFLGLAMSMQLMSLAPEYVAFGDQFIRANGTASGHEACSFSRSTAHEFCVVTQMAHLLTTIRVQLPTVSVILFLSNFAFVGMFLFWSLASVAGWHMCEQKS